MLYTDRPCYGPQRSFIYSTDFLSPLLTKGTPAHFNRFFIGSTTVPLLTKTLGIVALWNAALVDHSFPIGIRMARSYCARVSYGNGRVVAWYFAFCIKRQ